MTKDDADAPVLHDFLLFSERLDPHQQVDPEYALLYAPSSVVCPLNLDLYSPSNRKNVPTVLAWFRRYL